MGAEVTVGDLKKMPLPLYTQDYEEEHGMDPNALMFQKMILGSDLTILATPNNNRSISSELKNFIDWVSRKGDNKRYQKMFEGKNFFIMGPPGTKPEAPVLQHLASIIGSLGGKIVNKGFADFKFELNEKEKSDILGSFKDELKLKETADLETDQVKQKQAREDLNARIQNRLRPMLKNALETVGHIAK